MRASGFGTRLPGHVARAVAALQAGVAPDRRRPRAKSSCRGKPKLGNCGDAPGKLGIHGSIRAHATMTQIAYIGSCLSGTIVKELLKARPDMHLVAGMPHMRLDVLCDYLVDGVPLGAPEDLTFAMINDLFAAYAKVNRERLAWQVSERLEK